MERVFNFSTVFKGVFSCSIPFSLLCTGFTIVAISLRVMPHSSRNRLYYVTILLQATADFIQGITVLYYQLWNSFKVRYTGIWMFQVSVMFTAYLAIYWMNVLLRSAVFRRILVTIVTILSIPMVASTGWFILTRNASSEVSNVEWLFMSGSRNFAQISFGMVVSITCAKVRRITSRLSSPATRKLHRKVWIGLVYKTICSVGVALFGINTFTSIVSYGSLFKYMQDNTWWESVFFSVTNFYCAANSLITCWMLNGLIFKKKAISVDTSKITPNSKGIVTVQTTGRKPYNQGNQGDKGLYSCSLFNYKRGKPPGRYEWSEL